MKENKLFEVTLSTKTIMKGDIALYSSGVLWFSPDTATRLNLTKNKIKLFTDADKKFLFVKIDPQGKQATQGQNKNDTRFKFSAGGFLATLDPNKEQPYYFMFLETTTISKEKYFKYSINKRD